MAKRKAASKTAKTAKTAASPTDPLGADPVYAALALIAETGWLKLSLHAVAERSGLGLAELYRRYSSKAALLRGFAARIDATMLAALGPFDAAETGDSAETGGGDAVRDRLFEAALAEFEEHGVEASRVERIVAAAGTSWGTFFRYFPRKEDVLILAAARHVQRHVRPVVDEGLADGARDGRDIARAAVTALTTPTRAPPIRTSFALTRASALVTRALRS